MKTKYEEVEGRPFVCVPVIYERPADVPVDSLGSLIYGYLLYSLGNKNARHRSTTRTEIARALRLDKRAVDRAITVLVNGGAVQEEGSRLRAVQPSGPSRGWFRVVKDTRNKAWNECFVYDRVYLPRSHTAISVKTNALFWHLVKLAYPVDGMPGYFMAGVPARVKGIHLSETYLANGLGVYRKTVSRGLKRLQQLGLIRIERDSRKSFVVGIPPIGVKVDLWRDKWKQAKQAACSREITAETLFGVPSSEALMPADRYDRDVGVYMRAYSIKGEIVEKITTKIVKHQLMPDEWQSLLIQAKRDHDRNREKQPGQFPEGCGHLFNYMLDEHLKTREAQAHICTGRGYWTHSEMEATGLSDSLRLTRDAFCLVRHAVQSESLALRGGGCVPCRLNWDMVASIMKQAGKDFTAFKQSIAEAIFPPRSSPESDWYDAWMSMEQIPARCDAPMQTLGMDHTARNKVRAHAAGVANWVYSKDDQINHPHLANDLVRLGCWQACSRSAQAVMDSIDDIIQVLMKPAGDRPRQENITEAEEMLLLS